MELRERLMPYAVCAGILLILGLSVWQNWAEWSTLFAALTHTRYFVAGGTTALAVGVLLLKDGAP